MSDFVGSTITPFQFPPLREGRRDGYGGMLAGHRYFNSRPCARGDRVNGRPLLQDFDFNSRPCARGDFGPYGCAWIQYYFNSRPCARGDVTAGIVM